MEGPRLRSLVGPVSPASLRFSSLLLLLFCSLLGSTGSSLLPSKSFGLHRSGGPPGAPGGAPHAPRAKVAFLSSRYVLLPTSSSSSRSLTAHSSLNAKSSTNKGSSNSSSNSSGSEKPSARVLHLAESARRKLVQLKQQQGLKSGDELVLRLAVTSGGCSGLSYSLEFTKESEMKAGDYVCRFEPGISVVVDGASFLYVFGTTLDYSDQLMGGGFRVSNPNASKTCGCGMSFGVPRDFSPEVPIPQKPQRCSPAPQQQQQQQQQQA